MPVAGMVALHQATPVAGRARAAVRKPVACAALRPALPWLSRRVALTASPLLRSSQLARGVGVARRRTVVAVAAPPSVVPGSASAVRDNSSITIGFPKETYNEEKRAAAVPEAVAKLVKAGFGAVVVESGIGLGSGIEDAAYVAAGVCPAPN